MDDRHHHSGGLVVSVNRRCCAAAAAIEDEAEIACKLFLSLRAVRERLERLEAKLGVRKAADTVARVRREGA